MNKLQKILTLVIDLTVENCALRGAVLNESVRNISACEVDTLKDDLIENVMVVIENVEE